MTRIGPTLDQYLTSRNSDQSTSDRIRNRINERIVDANQTSIMSFLSLPNELIEMIFKQLNRLDQLVVCRLINKRCKEVIDASRIQSLAVIESLFGGSFSEERRYEFTCQLICSTSVITAAEDLRFLQLQMLLWLKKLAIAYVSFGRVPALKQFENQINQLKSLEHLQIGTFINSSGERNLRLNHIRTFAIDRCGGRVVLTAPALTKLATLCNPLDFELSCEDRNRLTHLTLLGARIADLSGYSTETLEYLRFKGMPADLSSIHFILFTCPTLRQLHIPMIDKAAAREMMKQLKIARNLNLVIYLAGLPITNPGDVERLFGGQSELETVEFGWVAENLVRLGSVEHALRVDYTELAGNLDRLRVDSFLQKFVRIQKLELGLSIGSEANLIAFLEKCKSLKVLVIWRTPLVQEIYNQLPSLCTDLEQLDVTMPAEQVIDLQFLLRFPHLEALKINREFDFELVNRFVQAKHVPSHCRWRSWRNWQFLVNNRWAHIISAFDGWKLQWRLVPVE